VESTPYEREEEAMFEQMGRWLDPILLIGLFVSIAVGVAMVLTGNDTATGFTIGLLSAIIALLIDIIARIQKTEDSFVDAAGLSRTLLDESIGEVLREIVNSYDAMKEYNFDHYRTIADKVVNDCRAKLSDIAAGSVVVVTDDVQEYAIIGNEQASQGIKAIHIGSMSFWNSSLGRKLFELNRVAAKHSVKITRVFALTSQEVRDSIEILKAQEEADIDVWVVNPKHVDSEFTIFDDRILVEFESDKGDYRRERIVLDPTQVSKRMVEFERLVNYANTIRDAVSPGRR
jgi:hypothetical protein